MIELTQVVRAFRWRRSVVAIEEFPDHTFRGFLANRRHPNRPSSRCSGRTPDWSVCGDSISTEVAW